MSVVVLAGMGDLSLRLGSAVAALKSVHGLTAVQLIRFDLPVS